MLQPTLMGQAEIIYRGTYSYRKWQVAAVSLLVMLVSIPICLVFILKLLTESSTRGTVLGNLFATAVTGFFAWTGIRLFFFWHTRKTLEMLVSMDGIRYGKKHFPWETVSGLTDSGGFRSNDCLVLRRRGWKPDVHLITDRGMDDSDYPKLMSDLDQKVATRHTHLRFV